MQRFMMAVLVLAGLTLSLGSRDQTSASAPSSFHFVFYGAEVSVVDLGASGCFSAFLSNLSASQSLSFNPPDTETRDDLVALVMDVENTCTGQTENVIVATFLEPNAFRGSSTKARVVGDIPYAGGLIHVEVSWVCTERMTTVQQEPGTHSMGCPARATGTISFRGETFSFSAAGFLSRSTSHSTG